MLALSDARDARLYATGVGVPLLPITLLLRALLAGRSGRIDEFVATAIEAFAAVQTGPASAASTFFCMNAVIQVIVRARAALVAEVRLFAEEAGRAGGAGAELSFRAVRAASLITTGMGEGGPDSEAAGIVCQCAQSHVHVSHSWPRQDMQLSAPCVQAA